MTLTIADCPPDRVVRLAHPSTARPITASLDELNNLKSLSYPDNPKPVVLNTLEKALLMAQVKEICDSTELV